MNCNMQNKHSSILFFKIITATSIEAGKLRIPNNFTQKYGGDMSNPMFLKTPDGNEWKVYHSNIDGDVWFQNGREEFAKYYSLDHGHMVLFEYKGASHFEVHIFDKSTLEIEYPKHGNQDKQDNLVKIDGDSVEILDEITPCRKTKLKSPMSCPKPLKNLRTSTSEDVGKSTELQNLRKEVQIEVDPGGTSECLKGEQLTSKFTSTALNRAETLRSDNPSFRAAIKHSFDCHYLNVPNPFIRQYFKCQDQNIMLQFEKKLWPVKLICYPHNGKMFRSGKLSKGWPLFARESKLKVGDVCVFELINKEYLVLQVHIFRVDGGGTTECLRGEQLTSKDTSTDNPSFRAVMKHAFDCHYLKVPNPFIRKYFKCQEQTLMLQFEKKLSPVKFICYPHNGKMFHSGKLSKGWPLFARESKLKVGDVCVFEVINKEDLVLDVHIFRGH